MRRKIPLILFLALLFSVGDLYFAMPFTNDPFWEQSPDAAMFERIQNNHLAQAQTALERMLQVNGKRTITNTVGPFDEVLLHLDAMDSEGWLMANVHPDSKLRNAGEKAHQKSETFHTALLLNRKAYDALATLDLFGADSETRYYIEKMLLEFRLAGVEKGPKVHTKIKALRDELVTLEQEFARNIKDDSRTVTAKQCELEGLPADYIARHPPGANGMAVLTIDQTDLLPVMSYAKSDDLRRRMFIEHNNRAYPKNMAVLDQMLTNRYELATLLGFSSWADYITLGKMANNAKNASQFLDQIANASKARCDQEFQTLLRRKQVDFPRATSIDPWEEEYWQERVKKSEFNFDAQGVRAYFPYKQVQLGIFNLIEKLFGVTFRQLKDAGVWHPSVECWEMIERGKVIGRFYLDMHPRPNKYTLASHFAIRPGIAGRQIPESALVCNFPGDVDGDPGLMEFDNVKTFFHEFGHLLHHIFAGNRQWFGTSGISTEHDFIEAPSQMLEEWMWDPTSLRTFARHYETGDPIPVELIQKIKKASEFGKALYVCHQVVFAKLSLLSHDQNPSRISTDQLARNLTNQYLPFKFLDGTHFQCRFRHLAGYSALVYTYLWSHVLAKDMFTQFSTSNLLDPEIARRYRNTVLAPGGSVPAQTLIDNFLGRPFSIQAWEAWLESN